MSYIGQTDFLIEVEKGNVPGHAIYHKFGRNPNIPDGSWEFVSNLSGQIQLLQTPSQVRLDGSAGSDSAAGSGAREVTIEGIDDNLDLVTEALATNGSGQSSPSVNSYWRVFRAFVSECGTYGGANDGNIDIETTSMPASRSPATPSGCSCPSSRSRWASTSGTI